MSGPASVAPAFSPVTAEGRPDSSAPRGWLQRLLGVRHASDVRQVATVAVYYGLLGAMYFVPLCRNVVFFVAACAYSFLSAVVGHNTLHQSMFEAKWRNAVMRYLLSFGGLFPISAVIPAHNLVHHHFEDDGQPDWAAPEQVRFRWNLLNLLHFPNVAGPLTFNGVKRWAAIRGRSNFRRQYTYELVFAFGLTGLLLAHDFWTGLFFVLVPQLWGARSFLRINIIQHDGCDVRSEHNHSRNFVGKIFNWFMLNNGYHTIHHDRAGMHFERLATLHEQEVVPRIDPRLCQKSMAWYLARTYLFRWSRPAPIAHSELPAQALPTALPAKEAWVEGGDPNALDEVAA
jgi:beta-carotene hydroxylase